MVDNGGWWWLWTMVGSGGGVVDGDGSDAQWVVVLGEGVQLSSVDLRRSQKWLVQVCTRKRSRRPFLMKRLRENKQSAYNNVCAWSTRRRHKRLRRPFLKKQTAP
ncbi:hypothetical protein QVD17_30223 [Tagetes erecta]|uniref:Secreted protein n=1 Tax=Tagetes erecta TaxID=13708 RepID=A0AAD8K2C6_TARER|nr:hypothetical protein QVD17_30223 [Tagetes erecta]